MILEIYDKASWHIDECVPKEIVLKHFEQMFTWLNNKNMLNDDGKEILNIGIDESVSLNENMLTSEGNKFMDSYYDKIVSESLYDVSKEEKLLDECYKAEKNL